MEKKPKLVLKSFPKLSPKQKKQKTNYRRVKITENRLRNAMTIIGSIRNSNSTYATLDEHRNESKLD